MATPVIPPSLHSQDAEDAVIGSILIDPDCIGEVIGVIRPDDFYHEQNRIIYKCMVSIRERGGIPNQIVVGTELQSINQTSLISTCSFCISTTPTSMDVKTYADEIIRFAFYRKLVSVAESIINLTKTPTDDIAHALDKCDSYIEQLRTQVASSSRKLELGLPRLVQTYPPKYTWQVNGKDLHLTLAEITQWGKFKNRVIAELNFVPDKPKNWDDTINALLARSEKEEAPYDASDEQQLKIAIMQWIERRPEGTEITDIRNGSHVIREVTCKENHFTKTTYYFFQSTPLLQALKGGSNKYVMKPNDLWDYCERWGGIRHEIRLKGSDKPVHLWGLPIDFVDEKVKALVTGVAEKPPEDF